MPRFVLLEHDHLHRHWDLMLETGGSLRTWRLSAPPGPDGVITAAASFDHRLVYLDYEGPISGDRGRVARRDHGTFEWQVQAADRIVVRLEGEKLRGILNLARAGEDEWRGEWRNDPCEA